MGSAKEPLTRTIPIPLSPKGVEMAAIVSSSLGNILEELNEQFLFTLTPLEILAKSGWKSILPEWGSGICSGRLLSNGVNSRKAVSSPFSFGRDDLDPLHLPFAKALRFKGGVFLKGNVNDPTVMGIERADRDLFACPLCTLPKSHGYLF